MTDHAEEQEMEAEALAAIFESHFDPILTTQYPNRKWTITLYPEQSENDELNHVAIRLLISLPATYPENVPEITVEILRGLCPDPHGLELQHLAHAEALDNRGVPCIFAVAEKLREWLVDHNRPGLDDTSAYATMMRKQLALQEQQQKKAAAQAFESQIAKEVMTAAELEELAVRKRRSEGTPCNKENFEAWKVQFDLEMAALAESNKNENPESGAEEEEAAKNINKSKTKTSIVSKMTGYDYFSGKSTNLEALEAAAEQAEEDPEDDEDEDEADRNLKEELFDEDVDLEDLDFEEDDDVDDDDEPDI